MLFLRNLFGRNGVSSNRFLNLALAAGSAHGTPQTGQALLSYWTIRHLVILFKFVTHV
jgi:hypothetical protein